MGQGYERDGIYSGERPQIWGIIRNTERKRKQRRGGARGRSEKKVLKKRYYFYV